MLSSIILSLAMNAAPVPTTDTVMLDIEKVGTGRKAIRIKQELMIEKTGTGRKAIRIQKEFMIEKTGTGRKAIRL